MKEVRAWWLVVATVGCGRFGFDARAGGVTGVDAAPPPPCANLGFSTAQVYPGGLQPRAIAVGDLDGDGVLDVVGTDANGNATFVYYGNGDGTFTPGPAAEVGTAPYSIAIGDLDGDGKADVVVGNYTDNAISIDLSTGRSFQHQVTYTTATSPQSIAIGDVDGDGLPDLVISAIGSNAIDIFHNKGGGQFSSLATLPTNTGPYQTAIGDIDGDGRPDLVAADTSGFASVLRGHADGTFDAHVDLGAGSQPWSVALGDVDGDGRPDAAIADNYGQSTISVLHGAYPSWQRTVVPVGFQVWWVEIVDMDGDGKRDVVVTEKRDAIMGGSDALDLVLGNGDGTFRPVQRFAACGGPEELAIGDFNGDGRPDVALACSTSSQIGILLATCP